MTTLTEVHLTEKQNKKAFNKKPQKAFKNILADPFSKYWPEANDQERLKLSDALSTLCPKQENEEASSKDLQKNPHLVLGLSSLIQNITNGDLSTAVFSSNLEPKFITRQIMTLALSKDSDTILLVVSNLEELMESVFGIKSYTFGIKKAGCSGEIVNSICNTIKEISARFPTPVKIKYTERAPKTAPESGKHKKKKAQPLLSSFDFDSLYLKRADPHKNAWEPTNSTKSKQSKRNPKLTVKKQWSDFICLDNSGADHDDVDDVARKFQPGDLDEERVRLKALLLSSAIMPKMEKGAEEAMECDDDDGVEEGEDEKGLPSIFLRPEETSGNQWASLLKPENITKALNKQQKRKEKKQRNKEKKAKKEDVPFHPMKVHKIQPNPSKVKKGKKIKKAKK